MDGLLVYTPNSGFTKTDTVTYLVTYADGSTKLVTVSITVLSDSDESQLSCTGAEVGPPLALGLALLGGGGLLLVLSRKRRRA